MNYDADVMTPKYESTRTLPAKFQLLGVQYLEEDFNPILIRTTGLIITTKVGPAPLVPTRRSFSRVAVDFIRPSGGRFKNWTVRPAAWHAGGWVNQYCKITQRALRIRPTG